MKNLTKALMVAGVALSLTACASLTPDNTNYVEDAEIASYESDMKAAPAADRSARIERAYNDSLRK